MAPTQTKPNAEPKTQTLILTIPTLVLSPNPDSARPSRLRSSGTKTTPRATRAPPPRPAALAPPLPRRSAPPRPPPRRLASPPPPLVASLAPPPPPRRLEQCPLRRRQVASYLEQRLLRRRRRAAAAACLEQRLPPVASSVPRLSMGGALNGRIASVVAVYGRHTMPRAPLSWPLHHRKAMIKSNFRLAVRIMSSA